MPRLAAEGAERGGEEIQERSRFDLDLAEGANPAKVSAQRCIARAAAFERFAPCREVLRIAFSITFDMPEYSGGIGETNFGRRLGKMGRGGYCPVCPDFSGQKGLRIEVRPDGAGVLP